MALGMRLTDTPSASKSSKVSAAMRQRLVISIGPEKGASPGRRRPFLLSLYFLK